MYVRMGRTKRVELSLEVKTQFSSQYKSGHQKPSINGRHIQGPPPYHGYSGLIEDGLCAYGLQIMLIIIIIRFLY